jgi:hypothetical protein
MRAEELRIGNWIEERFQSASVKKPISERDMHDIIYGAPEFWHPIPLTEEWLKRFGFNHYSCDGDGYWYLGEQLTDCGGVGFVDYDFTIYKDSDGSWGSETITMRNVKYVHQLQNLYFALTGEEL